MKRTGSTGPEGCRSTGATFRMQLFDDGHSMRYFVFHYDHFDSPV